MTIETLRLYQTIAEPGVPYPAVPEAPDLETKVANAPTVYYVRELVNPKYDASLDDPPITSVDTGKRFLMYVISGGPVLGEYTPNRGLSMAYIPVGSHLMGWWYNGQLFGIPLAVNESDSTRGCNIVEYPMNSTPSEELFFYDRFVDDQDTGILVIRSQIIGGSGINYTSGCVWQTPRYPNGVDEAEIGTNQFTKFLESGRSIIVAGEQQNRPADDFGQTWDECISQADCDAINAFYSSIGGVSTMSPADLAPPEPATDATGVHCFTGGIAADSSHPFCKDSSGNQNVFHFSVRGSAKITAGTGGTELAYVWDSESGTDSNNCLLAGNQYDAPGAGWCFLLGDADMINSESCLGPDMTTFLDNVCRLQLGYSIPAS